MTCSDIVKKYLEENGFTGLANPDMDCGCDLDDMAPCSDTFIDCQPAHRVSCNCPEHNGHHFE